ncbi:MAG: long-chain-fatty-acid--CoA ligase [Elusimicrobia bacterium]|nr:long-chain-fatty-acid--CoA ligase [Elusimicrobiota bacterium]
MEIKTLNDLLDRAALEDGAKPAIATETRSLSFTELKAEVLRAAAGFEAAGVGRGQCVALILRNSPDFIVAYFALARLGAAAVPINFMVQKPGELSYMLNDCRTAGVVTQREFLKGLRAASASAPCLKTIWVTDIAEGQARGAERPFSELLKGPEAPKNAPLADEQETMGILYTSGTTGVPKGVMLTHKNLVSNCENTLSQLKLKASDVALCILPMFHTFAWTGNVLVCLRLGIKLVVSPNIAPAKPWLGLMARHGVTIFSAVPQVYSLLAKEAQGWKGFVLRWWFFRKVRMAISGAAPLSLPVQKAFESALRVPILEGYGLTETSPVATVNPPDAPRPCSVGRAIPGTRIKIVDDHERELPIGEEGEICIRGDNVMKGYYGLPEATRQAFTRDGWFKSGDIGALDADGYLYIRDRKKDMIIVKGLKVFSAQVEAVLLDHPDVAEAAVVGVPDEHGDETIKAFLVLRPDARADKAALMQYCRAKFDPYKRPRDVEVMDALPKNALQKVLKRDLRAREIEKRSAPAS